MQLDLNENIFSALSPVDYRASHGELVLCFSLLQQEHQIVLVPFNIPSYVFDDDLCVDGSFGVVVLKQIVAALEVIFLK